MRRLWAPAALVAILLAALLWSRHGERASTHRVTTGDREEAGSAADEPPAADTGSVDMPDADDGEPRSDYVVGGHVVDSSGRPVPEARAVLRLGCLDELRGDALKTVTAADGGFRFEGVSEGPCELVVGATGFARADMDVNSGDGAVDVVLRHAASVEGLVVDGDGRPVAATLLRISDPRSHPGNDYQYEEVDASGRFRFDGRNPGRFGLRAITEDGREGEVWVDVREGDEIRDLRVKVAPPWRSHARLRVLVAKGSPRDVWFAHDGDDPRVEWQDDVATLLYRDPPGTRVPLCVREDVLVYEEGRTADRLLETAQLTDPAVIDVLLPEMVRVRVETDPPVPHVRAKFSHFGDEDRKKDGSWLLSPDCRYSVEVSADGFLPVVVDDWRPSASGGVLKVPLRRAAAVRGVVLDAAGAPVEGVALSLGPADATTVADAFDLGSPNAMTGLDGRFAFTTARNGDQVLVARRKYRVFAAARVRLETGRETDAGTLVAPLWRTVQGRVIDEARRPVGGAVVLFAAVLASDQPPAPSWWSETTYSHANGAYEIRAPAGDGFLLVRKSGYGTTPVSPDRADEIVLPRPGFVRADAAGAAGWDGVLWTCTVRWPDLVRDAVWDVGMFLPYTMEVAPGRIEVSGKLYDDPGPRKQRARTIDVAQGETAEVAFER